MNLPFRLLLAALIAGCPVFLGADEIRVATATNFRQAMQELGQRFEARTGDRVILIFGSSGKHYAQIINGAPFDAFFSADVERPERLERDGYAESGSRFTYAIGKLALWAPNESAVGADLLQNGDFDHLAIANPELAPYGRAAHETLVSLGAWDALQTRLVRGENIGQTFQFIHSGNAELGFVAWTQLKQAADPDRGNWWLVPGDLHQPIEQQAVLLNNRDISRSFAAFVRSPEAAAIIREHGYDVP